VLFLKIRGWDFSLTWYFRNHFWSRIRYRL